MTEAPVSTNREDWLYTAMQILVEQGAAEVKILTLANRMGCSRSNFCWFFKDREALLAELLGLWQAKNTAAIVDRATRTVARISQGVLNIFECWANPRLFDARLDFVVRQWAHSSIAVADEVRRAHSQRLAAITDLFARFGTSPTQAMVRTRTLYFMQLGYDALDINETVDQRMALLADYVFAFCGETPDAVDQTAFLQRNFGLG